MEIQKIIVLFKTHLDVGFTDFSASVIEKYNRIYIPQVIKTGEELRRRNIPEGFVWTTGSWLIWQYLHTARPEERDRMRAAIRAGIIRWHGLPFTMHSELCDGGLYQYGLSLSKELDTEFGVKTIGAKYTDVPGHTKAIVPYLSDAGIELLHIGVNPASTAPDVPTFFRWRFAGREINVIYNKGNYGEFTPIPSTDTAVCFAHTGDNLGPQSAEQILQVYEGLHAAYPQAAVHAGDLSDVARAVGPVAQGFPVVTAELGDTWIHGAGTDPGKVSQFRALQRFAAALPSQERAGVYEKLLMVPEHTWGLDEKTHLKENRNYSRPLFEAVRGGPRFRKMEQSWREQRAYVTAAVDALGPQDREEAEGLLGEYKAPLPDTAAFKPVPNSGITMNGWDIRVDHTGAICHLEYKGTVYADRTHRLGAFRYETFSEKEVQAFGDRYLKLRAQWALEDFGKLGLSNEMPAYYTCETRRADVREDGTNVYIALDAADGRANREFGCPGKMLLILTPQRDRLLFDFRWSEKPANRIPEALWLGFRLPGSLRSINKIGYAIDPSDVISCGNREMHATEGELLFENCSLVTVDAPLVAIGTPSVYAFYNRVPRMDRGVWVNLYNNQWGTNFPMWYEEDARFRFALSPECTGTCKR